MYTLFLIGIQFEIYVRDDVLLATRSGVTYVDAAPRRFGKRVPNDRIV